MSRLKRRVTFPTFQSLLEQQTTREDKKDTSRMDSQLSFRMEENESKIPEKPTLAVDQERLSLAVRNILVPMRWPDYDTIIKVPAIINWVRPINEYEYEAGITFLGKYPYSPDCSSIWKMRKIGDKFIPIHDLLNH